MTDFDSMDGYEVQSSGALRPRLVPLPGVHRFKLGELLEAPHNEGPTPSEKALHGLVGDVVRTIEPHTESDPVAILVLTLVNFGDRSRSTTRSSPPNITPICSSSLSARQ